MKLTDHIGDHKGNLNKPLRNDMNKIDDWVNSVVVNIESHQLIIK